MVERDRLVAYINTLLDVDRFQDYAPNGLQVEGRREIRRLVVGVTASRALLEAAIRRQADAVLVHHGFFWRRESPCLVGMKRQRLALLLNNDINLLAYHLPLDAHPELGNNARLARRLGLQVTEVLPVPESQGLVLAGELVAPLAPAVFADRIAERLGRMPLHLPGDDRQVRRIAWCSGGAQGHFQAVAEMAAARPAGQGVDAYLTGEVSESAAHIARETGVHFYAAGHHATERYGVQSLAAHLSEKFSFQWEYVEIDNPV